MPEETAALIADTKAKEAECLPLCIDSYIGVGGT